MDLNNRISAFVSLGEKISKITVGTDESLFASVRSNNAWFTIDSVQKSIDGIVSLLEDKALKAFVDNYVIQNDSKKTIGLILAGNLPGVGFHDIFMVLLSGGKVKIKLSSDDRILLPHILLMLPDELKANINLIDKLDLESVDAVIATGSNNTSRYFETYFASKPNIIRKNRTSCAVITGNETDEQITALGQDIFNYYGKGCRNVTKLFVPADYSFQHILDVLSETYSEVIHNSKYSNNYDYYKSIYLVNREEHLDTGFLILKENSGWGAPLSVLYYEKYDNEGALKEKLAAEQDQIQCVVGERYIPFGEAQRPKIDDFADSIDTMKFLLSL